MKKSKSPKVSVVMSVYNGEKYLKEAIDSILNQTFKDFEFIIINDGSTDNSLKIIKSYKDPSIILISRKNKGLVDSLNEGIKKAKGEYIARMDADDISLKERFKKQVEFLDKNTEVGLVGTSMKIIDDNGSVKRIQYVLCGDCELKSELILRCPYVHGSTMIRRNALPPSEIYRKKYWPAEDYDLWLRLAINTKISNLCEPLYHYRENNLGISSQNTALQSRKAHKIGLIGFKHNKILIKWGFMPWIYFTLKEGVGLLERIRQNYGELIKNKNKMNLSTIIICFTYIVYLDFLIFSYKVLKKINIISINKLA
jgi:glycosyltransferase involved in cell wall biosynthesis